jgi:hypothetical protein
MTIKSLTGLLPLLLLAPSATGQVVLGSQSFETPSTDDNSIPFTLDRGFDDTDVDTDYFAVVPNSSARFRAPSLPPADADGSSILAADDIDATTNMTTANAGGIGNATFDPVATAGFSDLSLQILLAAPGVSGSGPTYDFSATAGVSNQLTVQVSYDGGNFQTLADFRPSIANSNQTLSLDTDNDGVGDGVVLGVNFTEFSYSLSNANSVRARIVFSSNATREYLAVDNLRISGTSAVTEVPELSNLPATALTYSEGDPALAVAAPISISDADSTTLTGATVVISQGLNPLEDVLSATPSGALDAASIVYTSANGTLTISGSAPLADYQAVLQSVTYVNTEATVPNTTTRRLTFSVTDETSNTSNAPIRDILVQDVVPVQSIPYAESFETDGAGTRYSIIGRFSGTNEIFDRASSTLPDVDGSFAFEVEETDDNPGEEAVLIPINTSTKGNVMLTILVAAPGGAIYDSGDFIVIESSVGGGAFVEIGSFHATSPGAATVSSTTLSQDDDGDGFGDGVEVLDATFQEFAFSVPSADDLVLRIRANSNVAAEEILFDNIRVDGVVSEFTVADAMSAESSDLTFVVSRGDSTGEASVSYATANGSAAAADFTAASGTASFADGELTANVVIDLNDDTLVEPNETFTITLSSPVGGTLGAPVTATGTITSEDSATLSMTPGASSKITVGQLEALSPGASFVSLNTASTAQNGTVTKIGNFIVYVPAPGFTGQDSFSYTLDTGTFLVSVMVEDDNSPSANIVSIDLSGPQPVITAFGIPGRVYGLQDSFDMSSWNSLTGGPQPCPPSGQMSFVDGGEPGSMKFYRVIEVALTEPN